MRRRVAKRWFVPWSRDDAWSRSRGGSVMYRGVDGEMETHWFPGGEKWERFCADIPPELADALDRAQRKSLGVNASTANTTRANIVRAALRLYLNTLDPEPDAAIEGQAVDVVELVQLSTGRPDVKAARA